MKKETSRRHFIRNLSASASLLTALPLAHSQTSENDKRRKITLDKDDTILFQGDSITYWHRKLDSKAVNDSQSIGSGYALLTASRLLYQHPEKNLKIYNRGISGNTVPDLEKRWDEDCLAIKPDVLSILIGVNDYTVKKRDNKGSAQLYREGYDRLLERTKSAFPDIKLIIAEPFVIKGLLYVDESWFPGFNDYRQVVKELAEKYHAAFIPLHSLFEKALERAPADYWSGDGLHASMAGAQLMSDAWLKAFN